MEQDRHRAAASRVPRSVFCSPPATLRSGGLSAHTSIEPTCWMLSKRANCWLWVERWQLPSYLRLRRVIAECGRLPLALSVVGAMLRGANPEFWTDTLDLLRKADLPRHPRTAPRGPGQFRAAVEVSSQWLKPEIAGAVQGVGGLAGGYGGAADYSPNPLERMRGRGATHQPELCGSVVGAARRGQREDPAS